MEISKSCGAVLFTRRDDEIKYVLVTEKSCSQSFPKGHTEPGEDEKATALREIYEETSLRPVIIDGFREEIEFQSRCGRLRKLVFFLAEYSEGTPTFVPTVSTEGEILGIAELGLDDALSALRHQNTRDILLRADSFIKTL